MRKDAGSGSRGPLCTTTASACACTFGCGCESARGASDGDVRSHGAAACSSSRDGAVASPGGCSKGSCGGGGDGAGRSECGHERGGSVALPIARDGAECADAISTCMQPLAAGGAWRATQPVSAGSTGATRSNTPRAPDSSALDVMRTLVNPTVYEDVRSVCATVRRAVGLPARSTGLLAQSVQRASCGPPEAPPVSCASSRADSSSAACDASAGAHPLQGLARRTLDDVDGMLARIAGVPDVARGGGAAHEA